MFKYQIKKFGLPISEVIRFNKDKNFTPKGIKIYTLRQSVKLNINKNFIINENKFTTTIIDLTKSIDEIRKNFQKKSTRYEIKKAEKFLDKIEIKINKKLGGIF